MGPIIAFFLLTAGAPDSAQIRAKGFSLLTRYWYCTDDRPIGRVSIETANQFVARLDSQISAVRPSYGGAAVCLVLQASGKELSAYILQGSVGLRTEACLEAGIRRDSVCVQSLVRVALGAESRDLRRTAAQALIPFHQPQATSALKRLLTAEDADLKIVGAYGLAMRGNSSGAHTLWQDLEARNLAAKSSRSWGAAELRWHFPRYAARLGEALIRSGQARTRKNLDRLFQIADSDARCLCPGLAQSRDPIALQKLRTILTDAHIYHGVRKWAANSLGEIRDKKAVPYLKRALSDPITNVRHAATSALVAIYGAGFRSPDSGVSTPPGYRQ